jgi:hypothetical protein
MIIKEVKRKLAAILNANVKGHNFLKEKDEELLLMVNAVFGNSVIGECKQNVKAAPILSWLRWVLL